MSTKKYSVLLRFILIVAMIGSVLCTASLAKADPKMTGLPELTKEELQWQNKHQKRVKKVKLNKLGLKRINENRAKEGREALTEADIEVVPQGTEIDAAPGADAEATDSTIPAADMPGSVDNSQLKFFPPIRSQGSLPTCGSFSGTYYAMTYMWALANDLDARNGGDDFRLSPKWNNNMLNGGTNSGTWYYWCYDIGMKHGTATWAEFPYDTDYREWCLVPSTWYDAIYRRFNTYGYVNNTNTDTGIEQVKQLLLNGYVLNFPTYISSWQWTTIKDDATTTADDATVGKSIAYWVNGTSGYHAMTVVGYNDNIWTDVNGNGVIDSGEKGAFRIANSWGTGWGESGFCWMAYDALKGTSSVSGAPSTGRIDGWYPARAHWVTARSHYTPQVVAEFTLKHAKRDQLRVSLGLSDTSKSAPTTTWYPQMIALDGGAYAFDGTTTPIDGTFVFDFTDLVKTSNGQRYYLGLYDSTTGDSVDLYSYTLIDVANGELAVESVDVPQATDAAQLYTAIDYDADSTNQAPVADVTALPVSGEIPLTVSFDGRGSSDADGSIVNYAWSFGDGSIGSGATASHTYTEAGQHIATLTVTDDAGATATASVVITVNEPANQAPTAKVSATPTSGQVPLTVSFDGSGSSDADGSIVSYTWRFGDGSTGSGKNIGHTFTSAGQFTAVLTVTDDDGASASASVVITVAEPTNQAPTAKVSATPTSGQAPLTVSFDGSGSVDADGTIASYAWNFGDGNVGTGMNIDHTYTRAGQFTAVLTITDNKGATGTASVSISAADPNTLVAPTGLSAATNSNAVALSWIDAGGNEDGFYIERAMKIRGKYIFKRIATVAAGTTRYMDEVDRVGTYKYRMQAYSRTLGVSDYTNEVSVNVTEVVAPDPEPTPDPGDTFGAPELLKASIRGTTVALNWTDNSADESGFTIERGTKVIGKIIYKTIGQVGAGQTTFTDACGAGTFYYRVRAFKTGTVSAYSNEVTVRIK